ncbi:mediator of DNA damage checkpoint protein 1 isoform X2 [Anarrhichthys ocellatus]|uniref:mediator of DNA damage checkpoint protein 1 isoform X2 n=1 Tax=Anarrhichthys ocellatus TaxID=433405 RepID=UPI0012ED977B|nr:mediator of DNA damage checkpoint protein 1 isoform X2 [Anarrhichthys ocellatus]
MNCLCFQGQLKLPLVELNLNITAFIAIYLSLSCGPAVVLPYPVCGMDATQMISDSILESDEEDNKEENENKRGRPLAKLCILKNEHIPETELPLFLGDNVVGRDPNTCTLPLPAPLISKQHATICISVYRRRGRHSEVDIEALIWDLGSMNGTRKGHLKLTPNVRYALSERDSLVVADIPCQYVSCTTDAVSSKGDTMTPVSINSEVNDRLPDASGDKGGHSSIGSKKCVNGGTEARTSLPDQEETRKTPVRTSCLSFEQTPTQPQGTLVPESDSDSDEERGDIRRKALVSDSDSHKSGPTCSTFLSPTNKIVPESEDESPITLSSTKNRPYRHVGFSKEEPDVEVGQQQLKNKKTLAIVDDSEDEEERAAPGGRKSEESEQHVPDKQESNVSLTGEDEFLVSPPAVFTDASPVFCMDSDTDVEGEEERVASAGPLTMNTNQQADQPPDTAQFHMDSDTDVEDDAASDTAIKATSLQSTHAADSSPSMQRSNLHLDSDTDIDEEEEKQCGTNNSCPKIDETPTRLDIKPTGPESAPAASHSLHLDSDTDDEAIPAPAISELSVVSAVTESVTVADAGADLAVLSDSDTDVEDDSPLLIPVVSTLSVDPGTTSEALQSDSDADTDVDESSVPPAGDGVSPADLRVDSDTDVEDKEGDSGEAGENQIPSLRRENTPGLLVPLQQNCSTPVQVSEGELEDMETQAFLIPSSGPFRCARPIALSSCSDSLEDDLCAVAETQSFILQTRDCQGNPLEDHNKDPTQSSLDEKGKQSIRGGSLQLGSSDRSHLEGRAQALATANTQAFVSVVEGVTLDDTQAYAGRTSLESDSKLQAYGEVENPARCSVMSAKEGRVDFDLEATQAYISEPDSDSEVETDEDERKNTATAETQPFHIPTSSTLAMAETQPMFALEEEEEEDSLDKENLISSGLQVKSSPQHATEEREEHVEAAQPQKRLLSDALSVAQTQPMHVSEDEESDDEDLIPRKRKAKPLQLEEEQTQTLTNSELSLVETQPMHFGVAETQPMATSGNEESDVEDSIPGPRKSKAKQLWLEDEQTQTLTNSELSTIEAQPMATGEDGESDEEELTSGPRKRRAKALQLEEEETQPLASSEVSAVETQPVVAGEDREREDEDSIPGPRKRRAKSKPIQEEDTQPLTNSQASTVETKTVRQPRRGKGKQAEAGTSGTTIGGRRGTQARLREEEEQAECSEPPNRQTRGKMKALPTPRGRRGKSRPEEKVEQAKQARGKKYMMHQKDNEEEEETLETERNSAENNRIKEQEAAREEQDKLERERKYKEEQERVQAENAESLRLEQERAEKERIERERKEEDEKKRADKAQKKKEKQLERERKEQEKKERLEREKAEREEKERREKEREEEKERLKTAKREREEKLERERKEQEEKQDQEAKERQTKEQQENNPKTPARGRRAARKTEPPQDSTISANDDVPARRTRSRSNSSNSVSSEKSASSVNTPGSRGRGRGRGRGAKRTSGPPQAAIARSSNRRRTVAAEPTQQDNSPQGVLSRSNSTNSSNSEISSCSQSRGRGGRQRGRGRKTESHSIPPVNSQSGQNFTPKPTTRGRKSRTEEESSNEVPHEDEPEKADCQQASTTRGRQRANANGSKPAAGDEKSSSSQDCASEESPLLKRNVRGRGQKTVKIETVETPVAPAVSDEEEAEEKSKGIKRELEANTEEDSSSSSKISKAKGKAQTAEAAKGETKDESQVQVKRKGRASGAQAKKSAKDSPAESEVKEESEKMEEGIVERRGRGRTSVVQKLKKEKQEESETSVDQDPHVEASEPQTPTGGVSRKRRAVADSSPVAKTPRSSSASPAAGGQSRAAGQAYKVLFTGVVDEEGERVLARLGGSMAKGVTDMNCLVTDKVRRTVKFLCALAKGVPIVTTQWLEKSGKAGSFLPHNAFVVKDPEQENKFHFSLQESLRIASSQPLLQGYEIHVTKSVKPEPVHMKDIICCSGATFLPKMPSSHKPQTVVISCEEDWPLCGPALSESHPVVTAEFILTGILQQKLDLQTHRLSAPANTLQPAAGRGRSRKKT